MQVPNSMKIRLAHYLWLEYILYWYIGKFREGKMFLLSLAKLNNSISVRPKKRSLPHSGPTSVQNFGFLVAKWVLHAKKLRGPDTFCPLQYQTRRGAAHPPKIDTYDTVFKTL